MKNDPQAFCYWLQGHFELNGIGPITAEQAQVIADHLNLVFNKVTPERPVEIVPPAPRAVPIAPAQPFMPRPASKPSLFIDHATPPFGNGLGRKGDERLC